MNSKHACDMRTQDLNSQIAQATGESQAEIEVNFGNHGWTAAAVPSKFVSVEDVKTYLGASLPGDAEYKEEPVMEIEVSNAELPTSFDSAEQWPQYTVIANVHDQSVHGSCWAFWQRRQFRVSCLCCNWQRHQALSRSQYVLSRNLRCRQ